MRVPSRVATVTADDHARFAEVERELFARRWQLIAPVSFLLVMLSEIAAHLTPEFPKSPRLTGAMLAVLAVSWVIARFGPLRDAMGPVTIVTSVTAAAFVATACAQTGGFSSLQVLAIACIFAFQPAFLSFAPVEVAITNALAIVAWALVVFFWSGDPSTVSTVGMTTAATYLVFIGTITTLWVAFNRNLRFSEFVIRRQIEEIHRFAVEEVLCRHLPPRYVERVLEGSLLLDGPPERRLVTVVFADIVSFTALSDTLCPEELAQVMARFYDVTATTAFERGATIDKFIGDTVMAIVGAPEPMSALEQARSALDMAEAWQAAVSELFKQRPLKLRIGIHQDTVAVGSFGGRHRTDYTVLGMGVNIAARLEHACVPGEILVSREVWEHLEPPPAARALGQLELKGVTRPVEAWAIMPGAAVLEPNQRTVHLIQS